MTAIGHVLSSEEHGPRDAVVNARAAEEAGFSFALISGRTPRSSAMLRRPPRI